MSSVPLDFFFNNRTNVGNSDMVNANFSENEVPRILLFKSESA